MCTANGFLFFNATETLKRRAGSRPEKFYWKEGDMHFNFEGLEEYSSAVAGFMASALINPTDGPRHAHTYDGSPAPAKEYQH
jgi:hypothetical protein